jgi:hypothetical protein
MYWGESASPMTIMNVTTIVARNRMGLKASVCVHEGV